ncbi:MAG: hypothetical protein AAF658_06200, partial [Myxococcota bacterium]
GDGPVTKERLASVVEDELGNIRKLIGADRYDSGAFDRAAELFVQLSTDEKLGSFLTLPAYEQIVDQN